MMKYSVIDIGSNSVRLMTWADGTTLYKRLSTTRLGEGLALRHVLSPAAIERTAQAVSAFCIQARAEGAQVFAFATNAVRSAENGSDLCARVKALCGLDVDVVSGEREARLALAGALQNRDGAVIDIGGGSTEIGTRREGKSFSASLDIGAVRLHDLCRDDPALLEEIIQKALVPLKSIRLPQPVYAVGGTATSLAALMQGLEVYDGSKIDGFPMHRREVEALTVLLLPMKIEERMRQKGMDPRRADIIAGGAFLLKEIMRTLQSECVYASDRDNLEGYLTEKIL